MMMVVAAADRLREILDVWQLPGLRGGGEIRRELVELAGRGRIAGRLGRLGGALQVGGDLRGYLLILRGVRLLQLLQGVQELG